jgi:hypothetical protein
VAGGAVVVIGGSESPERETFSPALAIEDRLESGFDCFRKARGSDGADITGFDVPDNGFEIVTGSLFDCINAAMDNGCFAPA